MLLTLAVPAARAQAPSEWQCNFCTYASGWFGSMTFGSAWLNDAPAKFTDYRGIDGEGLFPLMDASLNFRGDRGHWLEVVAADLGTERRALMARGGREGSYRLRVAYQEIPKYRGFNSATPFIGVGGTQLSLPADWETADQVSRFSTLDSALSPLSLMTLRKNFRARLDLRLPGAWSFEADYRHFRREGTRPFASGVLTLNSSHVPAPVDFNNDRVDLAASWSGRNRQLRIGFTSSVFNNRNASLTVQNPFDPVGNTAFLRSALEPDSRFRLLTISGALRPAGGIKISGSASRGTIRQDGPLLPYSINPDFENIPLPRDPLVQEIDSESLRLSSRVSARLSPRLDFSASIRMDERDNRTAVDLYTPVVTDLAPRPETPNRPYSFQRKHVRTELAWRGPRNTSLRAGMGQREHERSLQSVRKTQDTDWWIEGGLDGWASAQLRIRLEHTDRDTSPYLDVNDPGLQENPLMRKFNLAGMQRKRARVELDIAPATALGVSFSWHVSDSDYAASAAGLQTSRDESFNLDLSYAPSESWNVHLFASREQIDSHIANAGQPPWQARTSDRFTTFGAGLDARLRANLAVGVELVSAQSEGRIAVRTSASEAPFPALETTLRNLRVHATYAPTDHWDWILSAEQERYRSSDWQFDGLGADGIPAVLAFGQDSPDYDVTLVRIQARYRF